jgi:hypothetical protein
MNPLTRSLRDRPLPQRGEGKNSILGCLVMPRMQGKNKKPKSEIQNSEGPRAPLHARATTRLNQLSQRPSARESNNKIE